MGFPQVKKDFFNFSSFIVTLWVWEILQIEHLVKQILRIVVVKCYQFWIPIYQYKTIPAQPASHYCHVFVSTQRPMFAWTPPWLFVFNTIDLVPNAWYTGGIFRVSKSAWNGLKSLSGTGLNPKTNVCLDPTFTVYFHYYRLGAECTVQGGKLLGRLNLPEMGLFILLMVFLSFWVVLLSLFFYRNP